MGTLSTTDSVIMTKNSERQVATDAPDPFVDGFVTAVPEREYQSKQLLNPPLKTAAGNPAGNSGAMPIQTGGREGKNYWRYVRYLTSSTLWRI